MGVLNSESIMMPMPVDIIIRILLWLPVESLLRLKRVSRDWLSFVESSHFIYQHYYHHRHFNFLNKASSFPGLILVSNQDHTDNDNKQEFSLLSFSSSSSFCVDPQDDLEEESEMLEEDDDDQDLEDLEEESEQQLLLDSPFIDDPFKLNPVEMVASCRGVICLRQDRAVCLWNPSTKQSTNLPPLPHLPIDSHFGFGFDLKTNHYKVVFLNKNTNTHKNTAHVYCSFGDNVWRIKEEFPPVDDDAICCFYGCASLRTPYRDTICCWSCVTGSADIQRVILSFDCTNDMFKTIPLPATIIQSPMALFILRENIACINLEDDSSQTYQVWMLNDYDVEQPYSWTNLYSIHLFSTPHWMAWFSNEDGGDFLLFLESDRLCLYDVVARQVEQLPVQVRYGFQVVTYEESLVSVAAGDGLSSKAQHAIISINQSGTGSDANITEVVVSKILLWLPVVSLLRFKLVCKSWCSLIKSSEFVAQHLHLHQNDNENIIFILLSGFPFNGSLFEDSSYPSTVTSYACLLSSNKLELLDFPYHYLWDYELVEITTYFDGIICLKVSGVCDVYLWNPAIKQFRVIADPTGVVDPAYHNSHHVGFGFDVKTNDYKLVKFSSDITTVKVYSLSTSSWRCICDEILPTVDHITHKMPTPYRKGINCWVANIHSHSFSLILSFDFSNEVFETIALPDDINYESHFIYNLAVISENIACIVMDQSYFDIWKHLADWHCEIWMMNEYGVKDSWTKLYTVGPFSLDWRLGLEYPKKNGDYMLLIKGGLLYEYDLVTQETKEHPKELPFEVLESYDVVVYKESLVPIK